MICISNDKLSLMITYEEPLLNRAISEAEPIVIFACYSSSEHITALQPIELVREMRASRYIKGRLKHAGVTYEALALRLYEQDWAETKASAANKLSRGTFSAAFFLAALSAIEAEIVRPGDIQDG